jgi:hypothetical protein
MATGRQADISQYRYSASGVPVSGHIRAESLKVDPCVLPPDGGFVHRTWGESRLPGLTFGYAYAEANGSPNQEIDAWDTRVMIAIEKCTVREVLTIGRMSAVLVSRYPVLGERPHFSVQDAAFSDVRVAGVPVQITLDLGFSARPMQYGQIVEREKARMQRKGERFFANGSVITSLVDRIEIASEPAPSPHRIDGNILTLRGVGQVRLAELQADPQSCRLKLMSVEFDDEFRSELNLGLLSIGGSIERTWLGETGKTEAVDLSTNLDEEEEAEVIDELNHWMNTHPRKDEPFLFFMGRSLTPVDFFHEIEEKTNFGASFLRFLAVQSRRFDERPRDAVRRAVDANRTE